jgi:hypothetical protein
MGFPKLFQPGQVGGMEVKNRIIGSPMEWAHCTAEGRVTQRYIDYLEAGARGGVGTMYTEATYVDPRGKGREFQMDPYDDDLIPQLARLVGGALRGRPNVAVHRGTTVEALGKRAAVLSDGKRQWERGDIDIVVPTRTLRTLLPVTGVANELYGRSDAPPVYLLGNCAQPRTALDAIHDAAALGHRL